MLIEDQLVSVGQELLLKTDAGYVRGIVVDYNEWMNAIKLMRGKNLIWHTAALCFRKKPLTEDEKILAARKKLAVEQTAPSVSSFSGGQAGSTATLPKNKSKRKSPKSKDGQPF